MQDKLPNEDWDRFLPYMRGDHDPTAQQRQQFQSPHNEAGMHTENTPNLPYRLAREMQEFIVRQAETSDYTLGRAERWDLAHDYALHLIDQNAVEPHSVAFDGLIIWNRIYGGGNG